MRDIFDLLNTNNFLRVHKSFVVNIHHVEVIKSNQINISNYKIPIGRNYNAAANDTFK